MNKKGFFHWLCIMMLSVVILIFSDSGVVNADVLAEIQFTLLFMEDGAWKDYMGNEKVLDENGIVSSIKSRDLTASTYQNGSKLESIIKGDVNKLKDFNGLDQPWNGVDIGSEDIAGRQLQIVVPNTTLSQAQIDGINNAIDYGTINGIDVIIIVGK